MVSFPKFALASVLLSLGACAATSTPPETGSQPAAETIAVSVGPCFGFCPVYTVAVTPAGTVTFNGERHTAELGEKTRQASPADYRALATALAAYRPATGTTGETSCDTRISDQSHTRITWTAPDKTVTTLDHDKGCRSASNEQLNALLQDLPTRLGIEPWARQQTRPGVSRG
jgi:hypothetical protein